MGGMETRLAGKIDSLETNVNKNKETIVMLSDLVNKNTVNLARLEAEIRTIDFRSSAANINSISSFDYGSIVAPPSSTSSRSAAHENVYWKCLLSYLGIDFADMEPTSCRSVEWWNPAQRSRMRLLLSSLLLPSGMPSKGLGTRRKEYRLGLNWRSQSISGMTSMCFRKCHITSGRTMME